MKTDQELARMLGSSPPQQDAAFRLRVIREVCARAQRRHAWWRSIVAFSAFGLIGLSFGALQAMGLPEEALRSIAMAFVLATVCSEAAGWLIAGRSPALTGLKSLVG